MSNLRLFIAVEPSDEVKAAAAEISRAMRRTLEPPGTRISWVREGNLHFTLKFLGDTPEETLPVIREALDASGARHARFGISIGGAGCFPGVSRPRVLWLGLKKGAPELSALAADVEKEMGELGFPPEQRRFSPHLTVARVKLPGHADFSSAFNRVGDRTAGSCLVDSIVLYSSRLDPAGAVYTVVHETRLSGGLREASEI